MGQQIAIFTKLNKATVERALLSCLGFFSELKSIENSHLISFKALTFPRKTRGKMSLNLMS